MQLDRCFSKQTSLLKDSWRCVRAYRVHRKRGMTRLRTARLNDGKWQQHMRLDLISGCHWRKPCGLKQKQQMIFADRIDTLLMYAVLNVVSLFRIVLKFYRRV